MNTKLLKQKILDLAIRGKLTQQLKSDGNTADLLKEISSACHPERSAKGTKSKDPGTIIPLDKSEAPFEIPANWEWVHLQDVGELSRGQSKHRPRNDPALYVDGFMPFVQTGDVAGAEKGLICKWHSLYNELGVAQSRIWPRGTICITIAANIGDVALLNFDACFPDSVVGFNAYKPIYSNKFFLFYLMLCKEKLDEKSRSTAQKNINIDILSQIYVPLPPLAEQQRIVAKIEEAFAEIEAIEKNKELLKTHIKQTRQKILDLAIHGKLVPQNKSDEPASVLLERITRDNPHYEKLTDVPFEIPESWEWVKLGDVCSFFGGGTPDKSNPKYWNGSINWASVKDIKGIELTDTVDKITEAGFEDSASSYAEKEDLILVTRINPGMCIQTKIKTAINQDLKVVKVPSQINKVYVMVFCNYAQKWFLEKSSGTTVKGIKIDAVLQMPFPLPPLAEQKRIVDRVEEIFKSLDEISLHLV